jgi:neopullulanase
MPMNGAPAWVADAVVYQVFPDRFRRSGRVRAQGELALQPWGSTPTPQGFQGGDLPGVIDCLDHLQELGVTCLYLTPIFSSAANHRYHTQDYLQVDPLLGGNEALEALITALHARGMRIVLDGVFNHCGRGFWPFHHLLENGPDSPYADWFMVHRWPLVPYPRRAGEDPGYACWWNLPALPKFNHAHPPVRQFLLAVGRHWLERGIDGWRLDVPDQVPADFWVDFRRMMKEVNPEAWIVGEIWGDASEWLRGDQFDGVMNYPIAWSTLSWVGGSRVRRHLARTDLPFTPLDAEGYRGVLLDALERYPAAVRRAQLNLLDSHDVPRALHMLRGDRRALALALLLLFALPGAPCLYYGTEAGLSGGPDPGCREAFPWNEPWAHDLTGLIGSLARLRRDTPALRSNEAAIEPLGADGLLLRRGVDTEAVSVVINRSRRQRLELTAELRRQQVLWPQQQAGASAPPSLGRQEAVVVAPRTAPQPGTARPR